MGKTTAKGAEALLANIAALKANKLPVPQPGRGGATAHFFEPNDAAASKLARAEPRDLRWVRAGVTAGLVSLPMLKLRMQTTDFLDAQERALAQQAMDALALSSGDDEH